MTGSASICKKYNNIYSLLVKDENDYVGMVAYSIYKREKIAFILDYKEKHGGADVPESEMMTYHDKMSTPRVIQNYRDDAGDMVASYNDELYKDFELPQEVYKMNDLFCELDEKLSDLPDGVNKTNSSLDALDIKLSGIPEAVNKLSINTGFWRSVGSNVTSAVIVAIIVIATAWILYASDKISFDMFMPPDKTDENSVPNLH